MFAALTLSLKPKVGNHPSEKSSLVSVVNFRHSVRPFMLPSTTLLVLSTGESRLSSISHSFLYHRPLLSHLHPALIAYRKALASSTNRPSSSTPTLLSSILLFHFWSHLPMTTRESAHVLLRPIGPPSFCL